MYTLNGLNPQDGKPIEITVRDGIIQAITASRHQDDQWLSRGFVDLQVNGYGGEDVNMDEPDPQAIIRLTAQMIAAGVTTYVPTIITASEGKITAALRAVAIARQSSTLVAGCIPYVHVEGPHISALDGFRGAHPAEHVRPPDLAEFARWQRASGGLVGMVNPKIIIPNYRLAVCILRSGTPMLPRRKSAKLLTLAQGSQRIWATASRG